MMPVQLAIFEFLGTTEMLVIAVVALIIFGPRKLPEIGRTVGKSLAEFKRASEDFKRTWEREVELERIERDVRIDDEVAGLRTAVEGAGAAPKPGATSLWDQGQDPAQTIARAPYAPEPAAAPAEGDARAETQTPDEPAPKHDWL